MLVYEQDFKSENNGGVRDTRLDSIGKKVKVEHGDGVIVAVEIFKDGIAEHRYLIEITDNYGTPILKSLFPDNRLAFCQKEIEFIK